MKKFIAKVVTLVLVLALVSGLMVTRASVLMELEIAGSERYSADQRSFYLPGILDEADVFVLEHDGDFGAWGFMLAVYEGDMDWTAVNEGGDPRLTVTEGRIEFDISGFYGALRLRVATWNGDTGFNSITRMYLASAAAPAAAPPPADDAPPPAGNDTVNPQTGDTSTALWLVISGTGLAASLAALAMVYKKKK